MVSWEPRGYAKGYHLMMIISLQWPQMMSRKEVSDSSDVDRYSAQPLINAEVIRGATNRSQSDRVQSDSQY